MDELLLYLAPVLLGDAAGMVRLPLLEHLDGARRYAFIDTAAIGPDLRLRARVEASWQQLLQRWPCPTRAERMGHCSRPWRRPG